MASGTTHLSVSKYTVTMHFGANQLSEDYYYCKM